MDSREHGTVGEPLPAEVEALFERALVEETRLGPAAWQSTWSWMVAVAAVVLLGWWTFTRNGWVPFLSNVDFGVHEFGHMIMAWAPAPVAAMAGSAAQVLVPLALAGYFLWRRDLFATSLLTAWAGSSLNNVSVYVYDATRLALPLWGDDGSSANHDWRYLLGPEVFDALQHTDAIAFALRGLAVVLLLAGATVAIRGFVQPRVEEWREVQLAARRARLPVREPRNRVASASGRRLGGDDDREADVGPPAGVG